MRCHRFILSGTHTGSAPGLVRSPGCLRGPQRWCYPRYSTPKAAPQPHANYETRPPSCDNAMSGTSAFSRVLSLRDRKRNTSKTRLDVNNLFTIEEKPKKLSKEEEKKAQDIQQTLSQLGIPDVPQQRIEYALRSRAVHGDVKEALRLLMLYEDSVAGVLRPFDPTIKMLGAENREKVSKEDTRLDRLLTFSRLHVSWTLYCSQYLQSLMCLRLYCSTTSRTSRERSWSLLCGYGSIFCGLDDWSQLIS